MKNDLDVVSINRRKGVYSPSASEPFKLSRAQLGAYIKCPRCFYLDKRMGIKPPSGLPFTLSSAVDSLLKKEFDLYRLKGSSHPLMQENGIEAVPYANEELEDWRNNRKGVQYLHEPTNLLLTGAVDDLWVFPNGEIAVVEYKSTSKKDEVSLDADWQIDYKRQVEFYQWLLRKKGLPVSDISYFVYCNADTGKEKFDGTLNFDIKILSYVGSDCWVEDTIREASACLDSEILPEGGPSCELCQYVAYRIEQGDLALECK